MAVGITMMSFGTTASVVSKIYDVSEIFVQLCKHLTGNPDPRSTLRGWILICLCVDLFPPSVKFEL